MDEVEAKIGAVAVKFLEDPNSPRVELGPGEELVQAYLLESDPPSYPGELIGRNLPEHYVFVRVRFDEDGRVAEISASPLLQTTKSAFAHDFRNAVDAAVDNWRCAPPRIRKFGPGPDDDGDGSPDFMILLDQKVLETYFDISFLFEVIEGEPVVSASID